MRKPGEKPEISATAKARIEMFHEQLAKLENMWGVSVHANDRLGLSYVDEERTDTWGGTAEWDAERTADGKLEFETFDWWGK